MSNTIDDRIVSMKFDNVSFESNAKTTLGTLEKRKEGLNFDKVSDSAAKAFGGLSGFLAKFNIKSPFGQASSELAELQANANRFDMAQMESAVSGVSKSFIALSTIAITTLATITSSVVSQAGQLAKSFSIEPTIGGYEEYGIKLTAIQTIMAATGAGVPKVTKALNELNNYSDKTIYSFKDMIDNIPKFTNAGVDLETSVKAIQGIAQAAAVSGANTNEAARAMYNFGQAIGQGSVKLMDWRSIELANMGTQEFKQQLIDSAVALGTLTKVGKDSYKTVKGTIVTTKNFGQTLADQWLTSEALVQTLEKYTSTTSELGKKAWKSATDVKTLTQLMGIFKEQIGSGMAQTFETLFGNLDEAKSLWGSVNTVLGGFIAKSAQTRNKVLGDWKALGGRAAIIEGISNLFKSLVAIAKPIAQAFRDIFPAKTGAQLAEASKNFAEFTKSLISGAEVSQGLRSTFKGIFAIFSILGKVVSGIGVALGEVFAAIGSGSGVFLGFTGGLGESISSFNDFLEKSKILETFFKGLGDVLAIPVSLLAGFAGLLGDLFSDFNVGAAKLINALFSAFGERVKDVTKAADLVQAAFQGIGDVLGTVAGIIGRAIGKIGDLLANAITPETFKGSLDAINTTLLGALVIMIKRFFDQGVTLDLTGGLFDSIKETLGATTEALKSMQTQIKADALMKIAASLGILTLSLFVLSTIDGKKLASALGGMAIGFALLNHSLNSMIGAFDIIGSVKMGVIASALVILSVALLTLSLALKAISSINIFDLAKSLGALALIFKIFGKAAQVLSANSGGMIRASSAVLILSGSLVVLSIALTILSKLSWEELARSLVGVAASLTIFSQAMKLMPKNMLFQAAALLILSGAMIALGTALKIFGTISWDDMGRGLTAMAGSLVIISTLMRTMPKTLIIQAAGLTITAVALNILAAALKGMGSMSWGEIAKGLVLLGGSLLILAIGLNAIGATGILGSTALLVAAAALTVLVPVLLTLGNMDILSIIKALGALAGIFLVLGVASYVLAPLVPVMIGLGAALLLLGGGFALAGAGALAFATAFGIFVATGTAGAQVLGEMIKELIANIPAMFVAVGKGLIAFLGTLASSLPNFISAMTQIIGGLLQAVINNTPKLGEAFTVMITTGLKVINQLTPRFVRTGFRMLMSLLNGINKNIDKIIPVVTSIVVKFINGLGNSLPRVINAGAKFIIKFINGLSRAIDSNSRKLGEAGGRLGISIIRGIASGISGAVKIIKDAAVRAAKSAIKAAKDYLDINSPSKRAEKEIGQHIPTGIAAGIRNKTGVVVRGAKNVGKSAISALKNSMSQLHETMSADPNLSPTIRPVLDLTSVQRDASGIDKFLSTKKLNTTVSYQRARALYEDAQPAAETNQTAETKEVKFFQYNYSPKSIGPAETYRNTRSQLAMARSEASL